MKALGLLNEGFLHLRECCVILPHRFMLLHLLIIFCVACRYCANVPGAFCDIARHRTKAVKLKLCSSPCLPDLMLPCSVDCRGQEIESAQTKGAKFTVTSAFSVTAVRRSTAKLGSGHSADDCSIYLRLDSTS